MTANSNEDIINSIVYETHTVTIDDPPSSKTYHTTGEDVGGPPSSVKYGINSGDRFIWIRCHQ